MEFLQVFIVPFVEILVISLILNYLLAFFWNTRAMDLVFGFIAFLLLFAASSWFKLPVLHQLMLNIINVAVIAIFIIFQPELRMAFSRVWSVKGKRYDVSSGFDGFLEDLSASVYCLAERRIGALIVLQNQDSLDEFVGKALIVNASFSSELMESLFVPSSPLHDGAVILRGQTIAAAAAILPLADDTPGMSRSMGTRHRAALGASQVCDALIIVVSEETGRVSIAREGMITQGVRKDRFLGVVRSIFNPPASKGKGRWLSWLKR